MTPTLTARLGVTLTITLVLVTVWVCFTLWCLREWRREYGPCLANCFPTAIESTGRVVSCACFEQESR